MARIEFNIDTDETIVFVNKLEKLHRAAFPNSVRNTLNSLAFDVKKDSMPREAASEFDQRNKNFFKAGSRVDMARGFNVGDMASTVGFIPFGGTNTSIEELEQQERGGMIKNRTFIATDKARTSKSHNRGVAKRNRISGIRNVVRVSKTPGTSEGQKILKSVIMAGPGGHILTNNALMRVDSIREIRGRTKFRLTALYSFKKGRSVKVKATHFMRTATERTAVKGAEIFNKEAQKQFEKYM